MNITLLLVNFITKGLSLLAILGLLERLIRHITNLLCTLLSSEKEHCQEQMEPWRVQFMSILLLVGVTCIVWTLPKNILSSSPDAVEPEGAIHPPQPVPPSYSSVKGRWKPMRLFSGSVEERATQWAHILWGLKDTPAFTEALSCSLLLQHLNVRRFSTEADFTEAMINYMRSKSCGADPKQDAVEQLGERIMREVKGTELERNLDINPLFHYRAILSHHTYLLREEISWAKWVKQRAERAAATPSSPSIQALYPDNAQKVTHAENIISTTVHSAIPSYIRVKPSRNHCDTHESIFGCRV